MFKDKRVFISGGAGVIGSELVQKLYNLGADIFVGDLKDRPEKWAGTIKYRQGDLNYITKEELDSFAPEYFFHLAATFERSTETYDFWAENYRHNIALGHHLMTCLKDSPGLKRVIFASSYLIYDPALYLFDSPQERAVSLKETDPIYPRNLTGVAKYLHEIELRFLEGFDQVKYSTVSARIYRVYGKNSRDIVSRWVRALLKGDRIELYGKEGIFDYIYAADVADGLLHLADSDLTGIVNLGSGNARKVTDIIDILSNKFPDMEVIEVDTDIQYEASEANIDKLRNKLGWAPRYDLEKGINELIDFESDVNKVTDANFGNVLITSASKKIPLINAVKDARNKLGRSFEIHAGDVDSNCLAREFTDSLWQMPRINDLTLEDITEYCEKHNISMIIPTRDGELEFFANIKEDLSAKGIMTMVSSRDAINICYDKLFFAEELKKRGFPVIETSLDISKLEYDYYVVKDRYGAGAEMIGLRLSREDALTHAKKIKNPIFQPFIEGKEYSIDIYVTQEKNVKGLVVRSRDLVVNGESQITQTIRDKQLEKLAAEVASSIGLYGHVVMQVITDAKGDYHIIEINSRFGGASTLSIAVGLDSFYWFMLESRGESLKNYYFARADKEAKLIRYPKDEIR